MKSLRNENFAGGRVCWMKDGKIAVFYDIAREIKMKNFRLTSSKLERIKKIMNTDV